ncbi:MAG TPA: hypothetical protein VL025_05055 [Thermoanaerobaculia bacterium]|nr:hypothetical protein [Thermoanaerobaculia bacterium]
MRKGKKLSAAVRTAAARERVTAIRNEDLVVVLGSYTVDGTVRIGVVEGPIATPTCNKPHVEYPTAA